MSVLFGRRASLNYLTAKGLEAQTGLTREWFPYVVAKELIDNALDACEWVSQPRVSVRAYSEESLKITVSDNGTGLSQEDIDSIRECFHIIPSTKYFQRTVTRGALGNAWACLLGIAYTTSGPGASIHASIRSSKASANLTVRYDEARDVVNVIATPQKTSVITEITVVVGKPSDTSLLRSELEQLVKEYRLLNPHIEFRAFFHVDEHPWKAAYPIIRRRRFTKSSHSNVHLYEAKEFRELVYALLRRLGEKGELGIAELARDQLERVRTSRIKQDLLSKRLTLRSSPQTIQQVYKAIRSASQIPTPDNLHGFLNKRAFKKALTDTYGEPKQVHFLERRECLKLNDVYRPILIQVGLADVPSLHRREECFAVNHAPRLFDPFPLSVEDEQDTVEVDEILSKRQLTEERAALILVNIVSPNLRYQDPAKNRLELGGIGSIVRRALEDTCNVYPKWRKKALGFLKVGPIRLLLREELQRRDKLLRQSKDGKIPEEMVLPQQALWYTLRFKLRETHPEILEDAERMHGMREDFPAQVVAEAEKLGRTREELGMYAAARAEQYFRYKVNSVSWQAITDLAKLGSDVIFVEKEGIAEALAPFAAKRGIALINSRGYASHYAARLMQVARTEGANGFLLTDLDIDGLLMSQNQKDVPRLGLDDELLRKLELNRSELAEPYRPKKGAITKLMKLKIPTELKIFLKTRRVELDSILGAVGPAHMWQAIEMRIVEMFPYRNLARSVDPRVTVKEIQQSLDAIQASVKKIGDPLRTVLLSSSQLRNFKGFYNGTLTIYDLERELEARIENGLRTNEVIRELTAKLTALSPLIEKAKPARERTVEPEVPRELYTGKEVESVVMRAAEEFLGQTPAVDIIVQDIMKELKKLRS